MACDDQEGVRPFVRGRHSPVTRALFEHGRFTLEQSSLTAGTLLCLSAGITGYGVNKLAASGLLPTVCRDGRGYWRVGSGVSASWVPPASPVAACGSASGSGSGSARISP